MVTAPQGLPKVSNVVDRRKFLAGLVRKIPCFKEADLGAYSGGFRLQLPPLQQQPPRLPESSNPIRPV